jgi:tetratricopeptide (TPR) repeat protein
MSAPGRNDPCPCGSGKKYKKCCTPKYDKAVVRAPSTAWMKEFLAPAEGEEAPLFFGDAPMQPDYLDEETDDGILSKLRGFGVETNRKDFVAELRETLDPGRISDRWQGQLTADQKRSAGDLLFCAAIQFSRRWAPKLNSYDKIEDLIGETESAGNVDGLGNFRKVWQSLKELYVIPNEFRSFEQIEEQFDSFYDLETVMFDYANGLWSAGMRQEGDKRLELLQERLQVCGEVIRLLPEMMSHNLLEWRRMYGQTLEGLGRYDEAEAAYEVLVKENPEWAWGYVSWGDLYVHRQEGQNLAKAREIYSRGLERCRKDRDALEDRLKDLG